MAELKKILHVEDEPDIREIALLALETVGGFSVESCGSGDEALEKAPGFMPDLFLMDIMMPGMDGPATLVELRKMPEFADTPVIFMTAKAQAQEVVRYKELGAIDVITKPFDPITLSDQIRKIWDNA
ncbi:MAG: response regulator [Rhodospirillales bacterium]|nr:response regulator [Rhodospirillales bacterium]